MTNLKKNQGEIKMWTIIKFDKKNFEILKKEFYSKLGRDIEFYYRDDQIFLVNPIMALSGLKCRTLLINVEFNKITENPPHARK